MKQDPGHVAGIIGDLRVRPGTKRKDPDPFEDVFTDFERGLSKAGGLELERPILSPEEWLDSPYYSGPFSGDFFWPEKRRRWVEMAQGNINVIVATGAVGIGKTSWLVATNMYDEYRKSCFVSPQALWGFPSTSELVTVLIGQNQTKAKDKLLEPLKAAVDMTPYFRRECPRDRKLESCVYFPSKNITSRVGVTGEAAIHGEDVTNCLITEANFLPVVVDSAKKRGGEILDVAQDLVESLFARWESRFLRSGGFPLCRLFLDSSRQYPDDYVERVERKILAGDFPYSAYVVALSQWEAKRGVRDISGNLIYSGQMFPVEVASGTRVSRILTTQVDVDHAIGEVVWCAEEHRATFETDTDKALRDLAGVAVQGLHPLIPQKELLIRCIRTEDGGFAPHQCRHPFTALTTTLRDGVDFIQEVLLDPRRLQPWVNPDKLRVVHCDPSATGDAFGLCIGHVSEVVMVNRLADGASNLGCLICPTESRGRIRCPRCLGEGWRTVFGKRVHCQSCHGGGEMRCPSCKGSGLHGTPLRRPRIYVDLALAISPPKSGRIQYDDVEALLNKLRAGGLMIAVVSADGHQSEQFLQRQLNCMGVAVAEHLSVDRTKDPYYALRDAVIDTASDGRSRFSMYNYPILFDELRTVEDRRDKIDHSKTGCFVGHTRIPLLDGTFPTLEELTRLGEVWVYASDEGGRIVPGRAKARLTKWVTDLVDIVLDSGSVERCTPDHPWRLRDGTYKAARDLRPGIDRLLPISRIWPSNGGYEKLTDLNGDTMLTHHMVWEHFNGPRGGLIVHHADGNKTNNMPSNLELASKADHARKHAAERHEKNPAWRAKLAAGTTAFNQLPETRAKRSASMRLRPHSWFLDNAHKSKTFRSDIDEAALRRAAADTAVESANGAARVLGCSRNVVVRVLRALGYDSWEAFQHQEPGNNHKARVVIPVRLNTAIPVYDLEVDVWGNFALASGVFVHNSKDAGDGAAGVVFNCERHEFLWESVAPGDLNVRGFQD